MKYTVKAYLCTNVTGLMDSLETDNFYEVQDFIWEKCKKGFNCLLADNETGLRNWAYADDFTEETVNYTELLMEQQEQM